MAEATLPQFLERNARQWAGRVAIREKDRGIWQEWTWADYLGHVRAIAMGLVSLGLERGDKIALLSDNRPQLYATMLATQAVGGVPVPLYQDSIARELQYVIDHADARFVYAEDQEQVDKVLELKASLPKVERVIYDDPKGMRHYTDPMLLSLERLQEMYREWPFFRSVLSNLDMVLAKTDLPIASRYAELVSDRELRRAVFARISEEWHRARKWLSAISGNEELLADNPTLARSIRNRFPYLDPLNHVQVELLHRYRSGERDERLLRMIYLTINGLAAGLRNSG